jgi:proteasome lid subunit RPN8/RPN11
VADLETGIRINSQEWDQILTHVRKVLPEEACGFVAGQNDAGMAILPITNRRHSPVRFEMDPGELLKAILWMEENGLEILAIYHSHPAGPPVPSETDLAEYFYPEAACLIISPVGPGWQARAFKIESAQYEELSIEIGVNISVSGG